MQRPEKKTPKGIKQAAEGEGVGLEVPVR